MPITNGIYQNPGWQDGRPPALNAAELNAISDTLERLSTGGGGGGGGSPFVVVGTSARGNLAKDCDFLCDGVADQEEINAAIQQAEQKGCSVYLLAGTYFLTGTITVTVPLYGFRGQYDELLSATIQRNQNDFPILIDLRSELHDLQIEDDMPAEPADPESFWAVQCKNQTAARKIVLEHVNLYTTTNGVQVYAWRKDSHYIAPEVQMHGCMISAPKDRTALSLDGIFESSSPCYLSQIRTYNGAVFVAYCSNYLAIQNCVLKNLSLMNVSHAHIHDNQIERLVLDASHQYGCTDTRIYSNALTNVTLMNQVQGVYVVNNFPPYGASEIQITDHGSHNILQNNFTQT